MTPVRPTFRDVSIKVRARFPSHQYQWEAGVTATQVWRDACESFLVGVAVPAAIRFARQLPASAGAVHAAVTQFNVCLKLASNYEARTLLGQGCWDVFPQGRHYEKEYYLLRALQGLALVHPYEAAAAATPEVLDLLDIEVTTDRKGKRLVVAGAPFDVAAPTAPFDPDTAEAGELMAKGAQPTLAPAQDALLAATEQATTYADREDAQLEFEESAADLTQLHFFRLKDVDDGSDGWTAAEVAKLDGLRKAAHTRWAAAVRVGDWEHARIADTDHQAACIMQVLKHPELVFRLSHLPDAPDSWPAETEAQVLARL